MKQKDDTVSRARRDNCNGIINNDANAEYNNKDNGTDNDMDDEDLDSDNNIKSVPVINVNNDSHNETARVLLEESTNASPMQESIQEFVYRFNNIALEVRLHVQQAKDFE